MATRIPLTTLNATTINILNTIRDNASAEYRDLVPQVVKETDIPKVGEVLRGYPAMANQFLSNLINRIALVRIDSMVFNNPYSRLKKGYLEYGETVEQIFVNILEAIPFSAEKADQRELKRYMPDVQTAFHVMNWRVTYPVTIQDVDLETAFLSLNGVQDLIARIVDSVYKSAEVDEFLLFKYMLIKAVSHGRMKPIAVNYNDPKKAAVTLRGISNTLTFPKTEYNVAGVTNTTPKTRQIVFMDSMYNAQFDVEVLASAFNMDKATFLGSLYLIDDWTTFNMARFQNILAESDGLEEVTEEELALMEKVHVVVVDEEWFQVYDNKSIFREKIVASGAYWNYFYHVWKTISPSPFHNAVAYVDTTADIADPETITAEIQSKSISPEATTLSFSTDRDGAGLASQNVVFVQTEALTQAGIAVKPYGGVIIPASANSTAITLQVRLGSVLYTATTTVNSASAVGATVALTKSAATVEDC